MSQPGLALLPGSFAVIDPQGRGIGFGVLEFLPWVCVGLPALAVLIPVVVGLIRRLNEKWFDPGRRRRQREEAEKVHHPDE
jgi:hypothetical protein